MATPFMTAAQVGSYFVTQYYSMLQQRPELVHQLYSDVSTMLRIDGHTREAATAMLQIHALVMSVCFTSIEINTAHSLESWSGGVIVMVTGSAQIRDLTGRKKFAQTFFLAPQEKGFFVLNDIFHFIEDIQIHPFSASLMGQGNLSNAMNAAAPVPEPASSYIMTGGMQARDYMPPVDIKENGTADKYPIPEQQLQQAPDVECVLEDNPRETANGFHASTVNPMQEAPPSIIEESIEEPQKHTYASVLRAAKVQYATPAGPMPASNNAAAPSSEWRHAPQDNQQSAVQQAHQSSSPQIVNESSAIVMGEDVSGTEDRGSGHYHLHSVK
uniref:NTF2 domain-containing protein n=1 Tax=Opuntia streptacantha TaxID=393608 RepID=A0A7C9AM28_OPUST